MKLTTLSLWLAGGVLACVYSAAEAAPWTLEQTLSAAQRYSAGLSASRNEERAWRAMADSARELPDPKLKVGIENVPVEGGNARRFTRDGMTMQRIGVMQEYVSSEKRERKAQTLIAESASVRAKADVILAALQRDAAQAWCDLALSQKALQAAQRLVVETERQLPAQKAGVGAGETSAASVVELQMALAALRDNVTLAERDVTLARTRLLQLTGEEITDARGPLPRYQRLPADPAALEQAIAQHPELALAAREAEVAKARSAQSAVAAKPDVGVEVWYGKRAQREEDMAGIMVTVDLPLFQGHRQQKDYAADLSRAYEANDKLAQVTRDEIARVRTLLAEYQAAQTLWTRQQQEIVPLQRQRLTLLEAQYRAGESDIAAMLAARRDVLNSETSAISAEKALASRWVALRYLTPEALAQ